MCVSVCVCTCIMYHRACMRTENNLKDLKFYPTMCVPGIKFRTLGLAANIVTCWNISLAPFSNCILLPWITHITCIWITYDFLCVMNIWTYAYSIHKYPLTYFMHFLLSKLWYKHLNCLQGNVIMCKNNRQPPNISSQDLDLAICFRKLNTQFQVTQLWGGNLFCCCYLLILGIEPRFHCPPIATGPSTWTLGNT